MATAVGLWIGAATSTAAILREGASEESAPEFVERDTVLYTSENGTTTLGVAPDAPLARTATDFVDMVGDSDGIVLDDGIAYRAEDLLATAAFCLLDSCPADASLALAHPQDWSSAIVAALGGSLNYLGLRGVALVPVDAALASSGHTPAHLAALAALAAAPVAGESATEQFPAVPPRAGAESAVAIAFATDPSMPNLAPFTMVDAPAYSAVLTPVPAPQAVPEVVLATRPAARRRGRGPLLAAVGAAAAFALVGGAIAIAMGEHSETAVPPITNAEAPPPATTTSATTVDRAPIAFPTVPTTVEQYVAPPVVEVAQVVTTSAAPPPPVETTPPPVETAPPPETTDPPVATTDPPVTTNEPTTTEPTTTEPTTTTESATQGRVQSGTIFTGTLQPTLLEDMSGFDDYYPPARPYVRDEG